MPDDTASPLLSATRRPSSARSQESREREPLLSRSDVIPRYNDDDDERISEDRTRSPAAASLRSIQNGGSSIKSLKGGRRWPTYVAISILGFVIFGIIAGAFLAPAVVEEYAKESLVVEPTNLSIHSITSTGVTARVQANFRLDAARVKNKHVRNAGRLGTWIAREIETERSAVKVYIKSLDLHLGTAVLPRIVVNIRNGHTTHLDFLADLRPGNVDGLRQVANDWLEGRLNEITLRGEGEIGLKTGIFPLGTQSISEELHFEGSDIPSIPEYNITKMNFHEIPISTGGRRGMAADVSVSLFNKYPVGLTIPPLGFDILVPNCHQDEPYIRLADATTGEIVIQPYSEVAVSVGGIVRELPKPLMAACPGTDSSPLDLLLKDYLAGNNTTVFVRGSSAPDGSTPDWVTRIISSVTVPVPFPGRTFDQLIKIFKLKNTHISLPSPFADEGSDEANPRISGDIYVLAGMPKEMNFGINISGIRASADVYYRHKLLGVLDVKSWQAAASRRIDPDDGSAASIEIESHIEKAPLVITDQEVFEDVIAAYYLGDGVNLQVKALLDIKVSTVLGDFVIKRMPAVATVPIKPISRGGDITKLKPKVYDLNVLSTDKTTINLEARVNFTNPTDYTAYVPSFNIHILNNGSVIGDATVTDVAIIRGSNTDVLVKATWDPTKFGGKKGAEIGRELLSQYISGINTTLTFETHAGSIPYQPELGRSLQKFAITIPTPRLSSPTEDGDTDGDGDDPDSPPKPHFIKNATFHVFSSTAQFTLISPLQKSTIFIDFINATALYNHTDLVGSIMYDLPFQVPPGISESPKLPVVIDYDGVGYGQIRKALGGSLKLDARGNVTVRLGMWSETVWYVGGGIGASIRF